MHLLENGVNLIYIRDILGHASIVTTEVYANSRELHRMGEGTAGRLIIAVPR
jgi:site-specific recombinase XerD